MKTKPKEYVGELSDAEWFRMAARLVRRAEKAEKII